MTRFRPCIDLHHGRVKQIVGGTLSDDGGGLVTNFESGYPAEYYADLYRRDGLTGGHLIMLGPGNEQAARAALAAWPGGLQAGGGIRADNAAAWLEAGASHVIVTSWLFSPEGQWLPDRLEELRDITTPKKLVIDLSCRRDPEGGWSVCMNRWQTRTTLDLTPQVLERLAGSCAEYLVHAADVEGKCAGMDEALLAFLARHSPIPVTYAGGARSLDDLRLAQDLTGGRVDVTIGSALDIFGGRGVTYAECLDWNRNPAGD
ncbi:MAG: phosphoribosylformimino-5-aminoimidazole carboxamide ribotide isomerase [Verrucomicrobiales bacterium]|nr:phosphoribosylformimino-5-aminoimidazole carboxamide ribotide isomerase [Verrucomicrobiales bacterium]